MKFLRRALGGAFLLVVTVGFIGLGVWKLTTAGDGDGRSRPSQVRERDYNVDVAVLKAQTVSPIITANGQVRAWRMLEIRSAKKGTIIELSQNFRDGAIVEKDELLFRVDPAEYKRNFEDAQVALAQARADWAEANENLSVVASEVKTARQQLLLKKSDLERKNKLKAQGIIAQKTLEDASHSVSTAEQSVNTTRKSEVSARMRATSGSLSVARAKIAVEEAKKDLEETIYRAPFSGPLTDAIATLGKRVAANEKLGILIDPTSLEVSFRVSEAEFGRLLTEGRAGTIKKLPVRVRLDLGPRRVSINGMLDRASSITDLASGGRTVFARIDSDVGLQIRPGDFVTVEVLEPKISNVAVIPSVAATDDGKILLISNDNRIEVHAATVVRRQTNTIIVENVPFGREYITARQPFLAAGIKVQPLRDGEAPAPTHVVLSKERREKIRGFLLANKRIPKVARDRILKQLESERVPIALAKRFEARMAGRDPQADGSKSGPRRPAPQAQQAKRPPQAPAQNTRQPSANPASAGADGGTGLSDSKRAAMISFVKSNSNIPDQAKQRILSALSQPNVPQPIIDRLESRMSGGQR